MTIDTSNLLAQVNADISAVNGSTSEADLISLSVMANKLGATRTLLDAEIQSRINALSGDESAKTNLTLAVTATKTASSGAVNTLTTFVFPSNNYPESVIDGDKKYLRTGVIDTDITSYPEANVGTAESLALHGGDTPIAPTPLPVRAINNAGVPVNTINNKSTTHQTGNYGGTVRGVVYISNKFIVLDAGSELNEITVTGTGNLTFKANAALGLPDNGWSLSSAFSSGGYAAFIRYYSGTYYWFQIHPNGSSVHSSGTIDAQLRDLGYTGATTYILNAHYHLAGGNLYRGSLGGSGLTLCTINTTGSVTSLQSDGSRIYINGKAYRRVDSLVFELDPYAPSPIGISSTHTWSGSHWVRASSSGTNVVFTTFGLNTPSYVTTGSFYETDRDTIFDRISHEGNAHNFDEINLAFDSDDVKGITADSVNVWSLTNVDIKRFTSDGANEVVYRDDQYIDPGLGSASQLSFNGASVTYIINTAYNYPTSFVPTITPQYSIDISGEVTTAQDLHSDGVNIWVLDNSNSVVYLYDNINSTGDYSTTSYDLSAIDNDGRALTFDGTNWFYVGMQNVSLYKLDASFALVDTLPLPNQITSPTAACVIDDDILITCEDTNLIYQLRRNDAYYLANIPIVTGSTGVMPKDSNIWVSDDDIAYRYVKGQDFIGSAVEILDEGVPRYLLVRK
jgi:hypothetical protein